MQEQVLQYNVSKYGVVALSEGLRETLAPRKIGVSVLCPGIIRTQIMNSRRNVPQRFAGEDRQSAADGRTGRRCHQGIPANGSTTASIRFMSANWFAKAIENDWPYIFTDTEYEPIIDSRFAAIKQGFDRIRGRQPRY